MTEVMSTLKWMTFPRNKQHRVILGNMSYSKVSSGTVIRGSARTCIEVDLDISVMVDPVVQACLQLKEIKMI